MSGPTRLNPGEFRSISCRRFKIYSRHVCALEMIFIELNLLFNLRFLSLSWYFVANCPTLGVRMGYNASLWVFFGWLGAQCRYFMGMTLVKRLLIRLWSWNGGVEGGLR